MALERGPAVRPGLFHRQAEAPSASACFLFQPPDSLSQNPKSIPGIGEHRRRRLRLDDLDDVLRSGNVVFHEMVRILPELRLDEKHVFVVVRRKQSVNGLLKVVPLESHDNYPGSVSVIRSPFVRVGAAGSARQLQHRDR